MSYPLNLVQDTIQGIQGFGAFTPNGTDSALRYLDYDVEYELIKQKKSNLPSKQREEIRKYCERKESPIKSNYRKRIKVQQKRGYSMGSSILSL